jgi:hypothetical protein
MVHIVPLANLIGAAMTPAVDSDDPKTFGKEKQHLVIPVVGA